MQLKFGKHKGKDLTEIPDDYLDWLVNNIQPKNGNFDNTDLLMEISLEIESRQKNNQETQTREDLPLF